MEGLAWFFWCLTPFGFFCTRNGTGLVTGFTFLILGFICKNWDKITDTTPKIKIPQHEYWRYIYEMKINEGMPDYDARGWADLMCTSHNAWTPPYSEQERIAREVLNLRGMKTEKEKRMDEAHINRIQFGKWYLMKGIVKQYKEMSNEQFEIELNKHPDAQHVWLMGVSEALKECLNIIYVGRVTNCLGIWLSSELQKLFGVDTEEDVWNKVLSQTERDEANRWATECVDRVFKEEEERHIKHEHVNRRDYGYQKKYEFWKEANI